MSERRVVIAGAGVGGLAAAIAFAAHGFRTTVIEATDRAGGKMRAIPVGGRPIDVGPTVLTMRWVFDRLFEDAGASIADWVRLVRAERLARHAWADGSRLDLYSDVDRTAGEIGRFAGARDAEGYRRFAKRAEAIYDTLRDSFIAGSRVGPSNCRRGSASAMSAASSASRPSRRCGARSRTISEIRGSASCSGATPPIAGRPHSSRRRP